MMPSWAFLPPTLGAVVMRGLGHYVPLTTHFTLPGSDVWWNGVVTTKSGKVRACQLRPVVDGVAATRFSRALPASTPIAVHFLSLP